MVHELELSKQKTIEQRLDSLERKKYYCNKCGYHHYYDSDKGKEHLSIKTKKPKKKLKEKYVKPEYRKEGYEVYKDGTYEGFTTSLEEAKSHANSVGGVVKSGKNRSKVIYNSKKAQDSFGKWLDTFLEEKEIDRDRTFEFTIDETWNYMPLGVVIDTIKTLPKKQKAKIKETIVMIDFKAGDVMHYFEYLAKGIARLSQVNNEEIDKMNT